jgi:hypothetical protein
LGHRNPSFSLGDPVPSLSGSSGGKSETNGTPRLLTQVNREDPACF